MTVLVLSVLLALTVSFLCSIAEAVLLSLTPSQIAEMSQRHPTAGRIWQEFKNDIERPISAILILNTTAHTIGAALAGAQVNKLYEGRGIVVFSLIFTFLMLQFTEILPKTLGVHHNRLLGLWVGRPLEWTSRLLRPVIRLVHCINRPFERRPAAPGQATLEEISALAGMARLTNLIGRKEERIIHEASRLSQLPVERVMIPVEQVTFLSTDQTLVDAIIAAHMDPHTRFPVCEAGDINRVVGYVNFKEMIYFMRTNPGNPSLQGIIRPVHFAPPEQDAASLMRIFVDQHVHIAVVRDAQGRTLGMVTLEDIVEQLVGEIEDEFDRLPRMAHSLSGGMWMIGGGLPLAAVGKLLGLPELQGEGDLSTWLMQRMGRYPRRGDALRVGSYDFIIRRLRRGKIFEVTVTRAGEPNPMVARA